MSNFESENFINSYFENTKNEYITKRINNTRNVLCLVKFEITSLTLLQCLAFPFNVFGLPEEHININFSSECFGNSFVKSFISRLVHCEFASIVFFVTQIQKRFSLIEDMISILHNIVFSA